MATEVGQQLKHPDNLAADTASVKPRIDTSQPQQVAKERPDPNGIMGAGAKRHLEADHEQKPSFAQRAPDFATPAQFRPGTSQHQALNHKIDETIQSLGGEKGQSANLDTPLKKIAFMACLEAGDAVGLAELLNKNKVQPKKEGNDLNTEYSADGPEPFVKRYSLDWTIEQKNQFREEWKEELRAKAKEFKEFMKVSAENAPESKADEKMMERTRDDLLHGSSHAGHAEAKVPEAALDKEKLPKFTSEDKAEMADEVLKLTGRTVLNKEQLGNLTDEQLVKLLRCAAAASQTDDSNSPAQQALNKYATQELGLRLQMGPSPVANLSPEMRPLVAAVLTGMADDYEKVASAAAALVGEAAGDTSKTGVDANAAASAAVESIAAPTPAPEPSPAPAPAPEPNASAAPPRGGNAPAPAPVASASAPVASSRSTSTPRGGRPAAPAPAPASAPTRGAGAPALNAHGLSAPTPTPGAAVPAADSANTSSASMSACPVPASPFGGAAALAKDLEEKRLEQDNPTLKPLSIENGLAPKK